MVEVEGHCMVEVEGHCMVEVEGHCMVEVEGHCMVEVEYLVISQIGGASLDRVKHCIALPF